LKDSAQSLQTREIGFCVGTAWNFGPQGSAEKCPNPSHAKLRGKKDVLRKPAGLQIKKNKPEEKKEI